MEAKLRSYRESSLSELMSVFGAWIPFTRLQPKSSEANSRCRDYSLAVTFWAFLWQVLTPRTSCREVVRKVQSFCSELKLKMPGSSNVAYCKARGRLPVKDVDAVHSSVLGRVLSRVGREQCWLGRNVKVVDGTGIKLPDTPENQAAFPQPGEQRSGCGFPVMQVVGCFCLASGAIVDWVETELKSHECRIFRRMLNMFSKKDVVLGDRGFCSFANLSMLVTNGVDAVMRLQQRRGADFREGKCLGPLDRLITWTRPLAPAAGWSRTEWNELPKELTLRVVRIKLEIKGFRVHQYDLVTTLTDAEVYTKEHLAELYFRRWAVELYFRQIKTTMGMEKLRRKTPEMVRKELRMHLIAYNRVRGLMQEAAQVENTRLDRVSFKGAVDTLRQFSSALNATKGRPRVQQRIVDEMLAIIGQETVPERIHRSEPRAVKERPKPYPRLTSHRSVYVVPNSRKSKGKRPRKTVDKVA
ncbi:MAG: IS4 family transposase [Puniceicoccaceae bacterium]